MSTNMPRLKSQASGLWVVSTAKTVTASLMESLDSWRMDLLHLTTPSKVRRRVLWILGYRPTSCRPCGSLLKLARQQTVVPSAGYGCGRASFVPRRLTDVNTVSKIRWLWIVKTSTCRWSYGMRIVPACIARSGFLVSQCLKRAGLGWLCLIVTVTVTVST